MCILTNPKKLEQFSKKYAVLTKNKRGPSLITALRQCSQETPCHYLLTQHYYWKLRNSNFFTVQPKWNKMTMDKKKCCRLPCDSLVWRHKGQMMNKKP